MPINQIKVKNNILLRNKKWILIILKICFKKENPTIDILETVDLVILI